ncbi:hypothetical protein Tco_0110630 [Tanacetum coccineum]
MTQCEMPNLDSRFQKLEDENVLLSFQVSSLVKERMHLKVRAQLQDKFSEQKNGLEETQFILKVVEKNDLSKIVTSHLNTNKDYRNTIDDQFKWHVLGIPSPSRIVEIILWYLDSGCSKNMTRQSDKLINFVSKFNGTPMFGEYFQPSPSDVSPTISAVTLSQDIAGTTSSATVDQDAPNASTTPNTESITTPM